MREVIILGLSGSIGTQTLDIIKDHPDAFSIVAVSVGKNVSYLDAFLKDNSVKNAYALSVNEKLRAKYPDVNFYEGDDGIEKMLLDVKHDLLVNALVGFVGFRPTFVDIQRGIDVALANKESLVVGGDLIKKAMGQSGAKLFPIDSEHSAIAQLISGKRKEDIRRLIITASGGAFRDRERSELRHVKKEDALRHPTWSMGQKITIDSATMMNKGFEIIEAHYLFDIPYKRIAVVMHPESIVHSLVEFNDGSILAQLSEPDMHLAISYALFGRHLPYTAQKALDLVKCGQLHFADLDPLRFPLLKVAKMVGELAGNLGAVINGANDTAVNLFLKDEIPFLMIEETIIEAVKEAEYIKEPTPQQVKASYEEAVRFATRYAKKNADIG